MMILARSARILACVCLALAGMPVHAEQSSGDAGPVMLAQVPAPPQPVLAAVPAVSSVSAAPEGMKGTISLDLRNIDVVDALKFVAMKGGINIMTSKAVSGRVTLMVTSALIQDVFDMMLRSNNLAYDRQGDLYNVMSQEEYRILYGKNFSDVRRVKVFYLNYTIPSEAFKMIDLLKSEIGRLVVDPETGNVLVMDSPERLEMITQALKEYEEKNAVKVFKLNYAKAKDIEEALKNQIDSKGVGSIKADERGNKIIVATLPERMAQIEQLIQALDQKTKEVIIDVNIVQVLLSDAVGTGIEWEGLFDVARSHGLTYLGSVPFSAVQSTSADWISRKTAWTNTGYVGSYPSSGYTSNYSGGSSSIGLEELHLGVVGKHDVDFILRYLQTKGNTKVMSNPKIAVVNNQEAKIHVGSNLAYVTTTTTAGQTTNTISEQVNYEKTGILLNVTPEINDDGFVNLKVKAEVNEHTKTYTTPTGNEIPIIDTSTAETTVLVKEGTTVIIGGLRKEIATKTVNQTPVLGNIPLLGHLFKQTVTGKQKSELLIIMTPRLISGEVFVAGNDVKHVNVIPFKPMKDYAGAGQELDQALSDQVYLPAEPKKLEMKGLRK